MDLAELGVEITQKGVAESEKSLDGFSVSAYRAQKAQEALTGSTKNVSTATSEMASSVEGGATSLGSLLSSIGPVLAAVAGFATAALSVQKFVSATADSAAGQAQLEAALKSTHAASGQTIDSLNAYAAQLQATTNFEDDAVNKAQGLLLTFTKIGKDVFPQATKAIADLATRMGGDLQGATIQVGKALNDPIAGLAGLSKAGIQFTEDQKKLITSMVEANNVTGAQTIILKELENQFGGSAEAARKTLGGAIESLNNAFGNLFEVSGPAVENLRASIEGLISSLTTDAFADFANTIGTVLFEGLTLAIQGVTLLTDSLPKLLDILTVLGPALLVVFGPAIYTALAGLATLVYTSLIPAFVTLSAVMSANPVGVVIVAVAALVAGLYAFREELGLTSGVWQEVWDLMVKTIDTVSNLLSAFWVFAGPTITKLGELFYNVASIIGGYLLESITKVWAVMKPWVEWLLEKWNAILDVLNKVAATWNGMPDKVPTATATPDDPKVATAAKDVAPAIAKAFDDGANKTQKSITTGFKSGVDTQKQAMDEGARTLALSLGQGADEVANKIGEGGENAGDIQKAKIEAAGNVLAADLGATGRNIYDLWNKWGDAFIGSWGSVGKSIGDLLVDFQEAQTSLLQSQAKLNEANTRLANEQAYATNHPSSSSNNSGGSSIGGSGDSSTAVNMSASSGTLYGSDDPDNAGLSVHQMELKRERDARRRQEARRKAQYDKHFGPDKNGNSDDPVKPRGTKWSPLNERDNINLKIINKTDPRDTLDNISTARGERTILNVLSNNRRAAKAILS